MPISHLQESEISPATSLDCVLFQVSPSIEVCGENGFPYNTKGAIP